MAEQSQNEKRASVRAIPKVPTGISGFDDVLHGGLPEGRTTLVSGGPGAGKSVLALEFLYPGALAGRPGIFVTFEESADAVRQNARALGWDLEALEQSGKLFLMHADVPADMVLSGEFSIGGLLAILAGKLNELEARCLVLDAVDVLMQVFRDPAREHNEFHALNNWLRQRSLTTVLTVKSAEDGAVLYPFLDFMADCVIRLDQRVDGQVATRRLRVLKYRGSGYFANECPFVIDATAEVGGLSMLPVSAVALAQPPLETRVSTGVLSLDDLTGGGYWRGSCTLLVGASGTGKTTLACTFAAAACRRNEKVLFVSFEESAAALIQAMGNIGIDLGTPHDAGRLRLLSAMPEALGVEEHLHQILRAMDAFAPDHLVVDAVSACRRMGSDHAPFDFLVRLLTHCKSRGITCLYTNQIIDHAEPQDASGIGIASLVDTLVQLRLVARDRALERDLLVIKSRGSNHSLLQHRFAITDEGLELPVSAAGDMHSPAVAGPAAAGGRE
jgi:circadian clock protein KaiC